MASLNESEWELFRHAQKDIEHDMLFYGAEDLETAPRLNLLSIPYGMGVIAVHENNEEIVFRPVPHSGDEREPRNDMMIFCQLLGRSQLQGIEEGGFFYVDGSVSLRSIEQETPPGHLYKGYHMKYRPAIMETTRLITDGFTGETIDTITRSDEFWLTGALTRLYREPQPHATRLRVF